MPRIESLLSISDIIMDAQSHAQALQDIVSFLRKTLSSDVCSLYLLSRIRSDELVLESSDGLSAEAAGQVRMSIREGLTGLCYRNKDYTFIRNAPRHPEFKYFPGIGEEPFQTFVGIPLKSSSHTFGVLVLQFRNNRNNTRTRHRFLTAVAAQVASAVLRYYVLEDQYQEDESSGGERRIQGTPLADGISIGRPAQVLLHYVEGTAEEIEPDHELQLLDKALNKARRDISSMQTRLEAGGQTYESEIFQSHLLMLQDQRFIGEVRKYIQSHQTSAAIAVRHVADRLIHRFRALPDQYLRDRAWDIEDISHRLMFHLGAVTRKTSLRRDSIVVASALSPGETAALDLDRVRGFVTERDGLTSHTAILARNRRIPAVTGIRHLYDLTEGVDQIILDGFAGLLIINPHEETLQEYRQRQRSWEQRLTQVPALAGDPVLPEYGPVYFHANVASVLDARRAAESRARGIGLVRTEIFYLQNDGQFGYEDQVQAYTQILEAFGDGPVIFRLFDIGSDKKSTREFEESNPALGHRGARLLISDDLLLGEQLRALLQVHRSRPIDIMVPFVASAAEFEAISERIRAMAEDERIDCPRIGVMIEIPSAVFQIGQLGEMADFFSIGTNDLFQYFYALDRTNPRVSNMFSPNAPAFREFLGMIYERVQATGKPVEICGEIAADRSVLRDMIAIGYRHFSINPYILDELKHYLCLSCGARMEEPRDD